MNTNTAVKLNESLLKCVFDKGMPPHMSKEENIIHDGCGSPLPNVAREPFTPDILDSYSHMTLASDVPPPKSFRVGVLTTNLDTVGRTVYAIANPASPCVVSAVATLDSVNADDIREWVRSNGIGPRHGDIVVDTGDAGFREIIAGSDIDAVYLSLPLE